MDTDTQLLDAARAWTAEHRDRLGIVPSATADVARRLLEIGVLARAPDGSLRSQAGGSPADLVASLRNDPANHHLFAVPVAATASPNQDPRKMGAAARLEYANTLAKGGK